MNKAENTQEIQDKKGGTSMPNSTIRILSSQEATRILSGQGVVAKQNSNVSLTCTYCIICGEEIPGHAKVCSNCKKAVMKIRRDIRC